MQNNQANKKVEVRQSKNGLGLFSLTNFRPGQDVLRIEGHIVHWETLLAIGGIILENAYRFSEDFYLSPSGPGNYINHSCRPNAGIYKRGDMLYLKTIRMVKSGEELTFDYSTIIGDDDSWTMRCKCMEKNCRKIIRDIGTLPDQIRAGYIDLGIVPKHVLSTIE